MFEGRVSITTPTESCTDCLTKTTGEDALAAAVAGRAQRNSSSVQ